MSSLTLFCFGEDGNLLVRRNFTASELAARKTTFSLPRTAAGQSVDFYAIGNTAVGSDVTTKAALLALAETAPSTYNGTFSDVTSKSLRSGGFLMSGYATQTIESGDTPTQVAITLKRDVAKIAVQTSLSSDFSSRYPGAVKITSAKISRAASQTPYFTGTAKPGAMTFTHTQTPGSTSAKFNNLFYVFENGALGTGSRVLLTLDGIYDRDGDFSTEEDQVAVGYQVELAGASNNGQLVRCGRHCRAGRTGCSRRHHGCELGNSYDSEYQFRPITPGHIRHRAAGRQFRSAALYCRATSDRHTGIHEKSTSHENQIRHSACAVLCGC